MLADTAYGSAAMLGWLVEEKEILPHIPVWNKAAGKPELFGRSEFTWVADSDWYVRPGGKRLESNLRRYKKPLVTKENTITYRARSAECGSCSLKTRRCPNTSSRKIHRSIHEDVRDLKWMQRSTQQGQEFSLGGSADHR